MNINAVRLETGADELERLALEECFKRERRDHDVRALVMPAGRCELATKFARMGARVDIADHASARQDAEGRLLAAGLGHEVRFIACELTEPQACLAGEPYDIIFISRRLSNLPYLEARQSVKQLLQTLRIGGKLYLSLLGLHSELAEGYPGNEKRLAQRFSPLAPTMASKYAITESVCLYSERDIFMLLLEAGASVLRTMTTSYGMVKAIGGRI